MKTMNIEDKTKIIVAKITTPFGIKGLAKIMSFMQTPEDIFTKQVFGQDGCNYNFKQYAKVKSNLFIAHINEIVDRTEIEKLGKMSFFIDKDKLKNLVDEDEFYSADLIGKAVYNPNKTNIGIIKNTYNFGAGDIIEIAFNNGEVKMYPFLKVYFPEINDEYMILQDSLT